MKDVNKKNLCKKYKASAVVQKEIIARLIDRLSLINISPKEIIDVGACEDLGIVTIFEKDSFSSIKFAISEEVIASFQRVTSSKTPSNSLPETPSRLPIINNEIASYRDGLRMEYTYQGLDFADNYVHNNTAYGLYTYYSANSNARSNPFTIENNRFVDNQYGVYRSDTSSAYGYSFHIKDNLFKSSTWDGIFGNYYSREWIIENNTFDGDNDQRYGINFNRYTYKAIIGNNTFTDKSKDMYFYYCYCTGTNAVKLFSNSYSTFSNNNGLINVYNNLNIRTLDEDDSIFNVD